MVKATLLKSQSAAIYIAILAKATVTPGPDDDSGLMSWPPVSQPQPVPAAPSAPSWLQELRAEWQRCATKNAFSKAICREKARNRFCPGHWDEVKECEVYQKPPDAGA
ncbi:MAG: hypothetical protein BWY57_01992 [Betaproteobacteria bacterium ADurb.Bin341]|nr:MAG: hypothetical protein BWY57_01992 [Betaproteobacteria bacterium ADurb.Bin341]